MIRNAQAGQTAVLPNGQQTVIKQVYRAPDGRVTVLTAPDNRWHTAWELRPVEVWPETAGKG